MPLLNTCEFLETQKDPTLRFWVKAFQNQYILVKESIDRLSETFFWYFPFKTTVLWFSIRFDLIVQYWALKSLLALERKCKLDWRDDQLIQSVLMLKQLASTWCEFDAVFLFNSHRQKPVQLFFSFSNCVQSEDGIFFSKVDLKLH